MSILSDFDHFWPIESNLGDVGRKCRFLVICSILVEKSILGYFGRKSQFWVSFTHFGRKVDFLWFWSKMSIFLVILPRFGRQLALVSWGSKISITGDFVLFWSKKSILDDFDSFWSKKSILCDYGREYQFLVVLPILVEKVIFSDFGRNCRFWAILTHFRPISRFCIIMVENFDLGWFWPILLKKSDFRRFLSKCRLWMILTHFGQNVGFA